MSKDTPSNKDNQSEKPNLSRRNFVVGAAGATAVAATVSVTSRDTTPFPKTEADPSNQVSLPKNGKSVLLVGGGLSGLITGAELLDRGFDVTILEKNATLGGRLRSWDDKTFGEPSNTLDWKGHPIEHGTHIVFNFYNNFRDFLARRGLSVRERTINYPMPAISFAYPNGIIDDREPSTAPSPLHAGVLFHKVKYAPNAPKDLNLLTIRKLMAFDPTNPEEVAYLDSISLADWCEQTGWSKEVVHAVLDPLMDMGNFKTAEESSALYCLRLITAMQGHWKDTYSIQFFKDSPNDSIFQPMAKYIEDNGGKIIYNTELDEFISDGEKITGAKTKVTSAKHYICPICGEIHDSEPQQCRRCGWGGGGFISNQKESELLTADHYMLGVDIPNAKRILSKSPFKEKGLYPTIDKLPTSKVAVLYMWYPRAPKQKDVKTNWEDHFGQRECLMTADFPMLSTVLNLTYLKKASFGEFDADIIETQIARMDKIKDMSDNEIAQAVDKDLRALIPGLPKYTDIRMMHWDNFSCGTVNAEPHRPDMLTPFINFYILGDWIKTDQNCFLMEKVTVNSKRAVNYLLTETGQTEGYMNILDSGTPNLTLDLAKKLFSVKA